MDISQFKQVIDRLSSKFETTLLMTNRTSNITRKIEGGLILNPDYTYKAAITQFAVFNTPQLITDENNQFKYTANGTLYKTATLPNGPYVIDQFNEKIKDILTANGDWVADAIVLSTDLPTQKFVINIKQSPYKVDFTIPNSFRGILGFNSRIVETVGKNIGDSIGNIENGVTAIIIQSNFIKGGYSEILDNVTSLLPQGIMLTIAAFSVPIGEKLVFIPTVPKYFELNTNYLNEINLKIVSNKMKLIDFGGQEILIEVHIKQV